MHPRSAEHRPRWGIRAEDRTDSAGRARRRRRAGSSRRAWPTAHTPRPYHFRSSPTARSSPHDPSRPAVPGAQQSLLGAGSSSSSGSAAPSSANASPACSPQARLDHRRGRRLPGGPGRLGPDRPGTSGCQFLDLLSADHHAIDDEFYRQLGEVFTAAQIIELGFTCASSMGLHRFIHTLDVFGSGAPVIAYSADQVDSAFARGRAGAGVSRDRLRHGRHRPRRRQRLQAPVERGDHVRALARAGADTGPLVAMGVEVVTGDVTDADDVRRAAAAATPPSTAPPFSAGPARIWPTSGRSTWTVPARARRGRGARHGAGGRGEHRHLLRYSRRCRARGRPCSKTPSSDPYTSPRWPPLRTPWPGPPPGTTS